MPKHAPTTLVSYKTYVLKGSKNALPSNIISGWVCWQKRSETLQFSRCWYCLRLKDIPEANLKLNPNTKHQSVYIFKILLYYYTRFHKSLNWKSSPTTWYKLLPRGILKSQDILLLPHVYSYFQFDILQKHLAVLFHGFDKKKKHKISHSKLWQNSLSRPRT